MDVEADLVARLRFVLEGRGSQNVGFEVFGRLLFFTGNGLQRYPGELRGYVTDGRRVLKWDFDRGFVKSNHVQSFSVQYFTASFVR